MYKIKDILENISKRVQPLIDMGKTKNPKSVLPRDYSEERKYIAGLIVEAVTGRAPIREVLLRFPKNLNDPSAVAAYHALIHYEADEELRAKDGMYKEEQDNYIIYIAETFQKGDELPHNIIKEYTDYYEWAPSQFSDTKDGMWEKLKRKINL